MAEIRVSIGRVEALGSDSGITACIRCFEPAIRDNAVRGKLEDSARLVIRLKNPSGVMPAWRIPATPTKTNLTLVGSDPCESQRVLIGLNDTAYKSLQAHKVKSAFMPPIKSRNSLTSYDRLWKTWPGTIVVNGDSRVNGTYKKLSCTHTVVLSALWRREGTADQSPVYLFYRPNLIRAALDVAVFSTSPSYEDGNEICELHDWIPENALKESTQKTQAQFKTFSPGSLRVEAPAPTISVEPGGDSTAFTPEPNNPTICKLKGLSKDVIRSLLEYNDTEKDENGVCRIDLFGRSGTRNAKRLSIIAAPSLLKFAAKDDSLPITLSKWYELRCSTKFGECELNVPRRPVEMWRETPGSNGGVERYYDAEESNEYYKVSHKCLRT